MPPLSVLPSTTREARAVYVFAVRGYANDPALILLISWHLRVESEECPVVVVRRIRVGVASVVTLIVLGCTGLQNTLEVRMLQFW